MLDEKDLTRRLEELENKIKTFENYVAQKDNRNELELSIKKEIHSHNLGSSPMIQKFLLEKIMGLVDEYERRFKERENKVLDGKKIENNKSFLHSSSSFYPFHKLIIQNDKESEK